MVEVNSFILTEEGVIPIKSVTPLPVYSVDDPIYGSISLCLGSELFIEPSTIEKIDELWVFLLQGVCQVSEGILYESYFPSHHITFSLEPVNGGNVCFGIFRKDDSKNSCIVPADELIRVLAKEAKTFFSLLGFLKPSDAPLYDFYRELAEELL